MASHSIKQEQELEIMVMVEDLLARGVIGLVSKEDTVTEVVNKNKRGIAQLVERGLLAVQVRLPRQFFNREVR